MLTIIKIITLLWPFVKELVFGQKTPKQILRDHKMLLAILIVFGISMATNVFLTKRVVEISHQYIALEKKYKALEGSKRNPITPVTMKQTPVVPAPAPVVETTKPQRVVVKPKSKKPTTKVDKEERYERLRRSMHELHEKEVQNLTTPTN